MGINYLESDFKHAIYLCKICKSKSLKEYQSDTNYNKIKNINNKIQMLNTLGNVCICCKNNIWQFLTLDHINNDGANDRKVGNTIGSSTFCKFENNDLSNYQVLCMNCNYSKGHNGYCSHYLKSNDDNCVNCKILLADENWNSIYKKYNYKLCNDCLIDKSISKKEILDRYRKLRKKKDILNVKNKVIEAYGNRCKCCDENDFLFLTVDHVDGGGRQENKNIKKYGIDFYRHLKKNNFPKDDYQLLCYNCNCSKSIYKQCYHKFNISIEEYKNNLII